MTGRRIVGAAIAGLATTAVILAGGTWSERNAAAQTVTTDSAALARQAFAELSTVLKHPRCLNCHTSVDYPRQTDDPHKHAFNVKRGPHDGGAVSMQCRTCHQTINQDASGVPGAPGWRLAPLRMAWDDLSPSRLCRALLDPARGGMTPESLVRHLASEPLVAWAWQPGRNAHGTQRTSPPLARDEFMALARKWVDLGATCPD
jgi:hypothetical protein